MADSARFPMSCGCVVLVSTEEVTLSRDEVERGCYPGDSEVVGVEMVMPCPLHSGSAAYVPLVPLPPWLMVQAGSMGLTGEPSPYAWGGPAGAVGDCSGWAATHGEGGPLADDEQTAALKSAQEGISRWAERQIVAENEAREKALRALMGAAIAAGLKEQASRWPGFRCDTTSNRDMLAVNGILTVSELVESIVKALSDG